MSETPKSLTHTPGPWGVVRSDPAEGADVWWVIGNRGGHNTETEIGSVQGGWGDHHEANARLIAVAPDLLTLARLLVHSLKAASAGAPLQNAEFLVGAANTIIARATTADPA